MSRLRFQNILAEGDVLGLTRLDIATGLLIVSIVMLGAGIVCGAGIVPQLASFTMWSSLALAVITAWPAMVLGSIDTARAVLALVVPGYSGPTTLFSAADMVSNRALTEAASWSWTITGAVSMFAQQMLMTLCAFFILIGLSVPGILAILAEISLIFGGMAAPLILGGLA